MLLLNTPLQIQEKTSENNPHNSSFIFRYLPETMGITIGNYLRRTIPLVLKGVALIGVKISDKKGSVTSKFTTLTGVSETTPYLILNLKKLIFRKKTEKTGIFCLELNIENKEKKEKVVLASDFSKSEEVEVLNPELELATLATASNEQGNSKLAIKLYCRESQGYHSEVEQKKYFIEQEKRKRGAGKSEPSKKDEEGVIFSDTDYSPIKVDDINFQTNSIVTGIEEKQEELILTIATNGTIAPKIVLKETLEIINQTNSVIQKLLE